MRGMWSAAALVAAGLLLPACTFAKIEGHGSKPLVLNQLGEAPSFQSFNVSQFSTFDYTGAVNIDDVLRNDPSVPLGDPGVSHVQNLRVEVGSNVGTFFVNLLTLGLANARVYRIKGDLVRK